MSGRPVQLLTAAAFAAAASLCLDLRRVRGLLQRLRLAMRRRSLFGAGGLFLRVVAATRAAVACLAVACSAGGYGGYGYGGGYAGAPMYVVNQGPAYTAPRSGLSRGRWRL